MNKREVRTIAFAIGECRLDDKAKEYLSTSIADKFMWGRARRNDFLTYMKKVSWLAIHGGTLAQLIALEKLGPVDFSELIANSTNEK